MSGKVLMRTLRVEKEEMRRPKNEQREIDRSQGALLDSVRVRPISPDAIIVFRVYFQGMG
jgi:hypothetical protein